MYSMFRKRCFVHLGASYQYSPETRSSFPSRFMSAKTAVSEEPRSIVCFSKAISSGRLTDRTEPVETTKNKAHQAIALPVNFHGQNMHDQPFLEQPFVEPTAPLAPNYDLAVMHESSPDD